MDVRFIFVALVCVFGFVKETVQSEGEPSEFPCAESPESCLFISTKPMTYDDASTYCHTTKDNGRLVTFEDQAKYQLTMDYVRTELDKTCGDDWLEFFWTGMKYETDDGLAEISGEVEGYSSWYPGKPMKLKFHPRYTNVAVIIDQDPTSYYQGMSNVDSSYYYYAVCQIA